MNIPIWRQYTAVFCAWLMLVCPTLVGCGNLAAFLGGAGAGLLVDPPAGGAGDSPLPIPDELLIAEVSDTSTDIAAMMANQAGEKVGVLAEKRSDGTASYATGAVYVDPSGNALTVWLSDDGLPSMAVADDWVFTFTNYTSGSVDVLAKGPDGNITRIPGVSVDAGVLNDLRDFASEGKIGQRSKSFGDGKHAQRARQSEESLSVADGLRIASLVLSITCCAIGVATSPTGVGAVIAVACCAGSIFGVGAAITDDDVLGAGSTATSTFTCALGDPGGCVGVGLDVAAVIIEDAEDTRLSDVSSGRLTLPSWFGSTTGFDFSTGLPVNDPGASSGSADFHMDGINEFHAWGTGAILEGQGPLDLSAPPQDGYTTELVIAEVGDLLVIKTREGGFARVKVVEIDETEERIICEYVILP